MVDILMNPSRWEVYSKVPQGMYICYLVLCHWKNETPLVKTGFTGRGCKRFDDANFPYLDKILCVMVFDNEQDALCAEDLTRALLRKTSGLSPSGTDSFEIVKPRNFFKVSPKWGKQIKVTL